MKSLTFARSADLDWEGGLVGGSGHVTARSGSFATGVTFPTGRGEPEGTSTPEELLAASHAACFGIGLRSVIGRSGGSAARIGVTATVTAVKAEGKIRIRGCHLKATIFEPTGLDAAALAESVAMAKAECTITNALDPGIEVTVEFAVGKL